MANHVRKSNGVSDKRAALAGTQRNPRQAQRSRPARTAQPARTARPARKQTLGEWLAGSSVYILAVVAVVLIALLLIFGVRAFSNITAPLGQSTRTGGADAYESPYDWSRLDRSNGRYAYVVDGQVKSSLGIDVSEHDYDIDWQAVAADGIDFAMIRLGYRGATEGSVNIDPYFEQNLAGATAAGLDCGVYFFSQAITPEEAREEAAFVLQVLGGAPLAYPVAFDWERVSGMGETRTSGLVSTELSAIADAFCDEVEAGGYRTILYGNPIDIGHYDETALEGRHVWWAEYGVAQPEHFLDIAMWQYSSTGQVAGMSTSVDMNIDLSGALS